jgi:hypothetical protein
LNRISILIFVCQHFQLQLTQWQYGGWTGMLLVCIQSNGIHRQDVYGFSVH